MLQYGTTLAIVLIVLGVACGLAFFFRGVVSDGGALWPAAAAQHALCIVALTSVSQTPAKLG